MTDSFNAAAFEAAFALPDNDGTFAGPFGAYLREIGKLKPAVVFAFPPKAGGTFLRAAAVRAIDGQLTRVVHAQGGRDAQFYLPYFVGYYLGVIESKPLVTHVHMLALPANCRFLEAFDLKPVVMVRALPDMLASYMDMLETDDAALKDGLNCQFPPNYRSFSRERKADFIIDIVARWYISYYATWFEYAAQTPGRVLMLDYDAFSRAPAEALEKTLAHAGTPRPREICELAVELSWERRGDLRFNRGTSGRGKDYFTPGHIARLATMLSYYPALEGIAPALVG
jgi:hypothetical protein